ncbi:glycosyltransferase [Nocardia brasiliensis]|uniref:Glycosyltransferase n=1 Tax=Nocardia brasiliensis TaxID=37326 RepID=A0A6G9XUQ3_NOCBR|nr:glycosyltransferase [Nocardia brasiliensis]QIS04629.1 glycosyltransferase [Nocardia brasiliensis]
MHVAIFADVSFGTVGGLPSALVAQRNALRRHRHRVTMFASAATAAAADPDLVVLEGVSGWRADGSVLVVPNGANAGLIDAAFAERGPVDVVHVLTASGAGIAGLHAARRHGIPLVQTLRRQDEALVERYSAMRLLSASILRRLRAAQPLPGRGQAADRIVAPSRRVARDLIAAGVRGPIHVVPNGIDDELLDAAPDPRFTVHDPSVESTAAQQPLRLLWCGRFALEKRPLAALEAVRLALDAAPGSCTLDMYGTGLLLDRAWSFVERHGLHDRVRLHGEVGQAECLAAMRTHDILLSCSYGAQSRHMVLREAVAVGLPILYCDPDLDEVVPNGGGVRTLGPSMLALAEALGRLTKSPQRLVEMRKVLVGCADGVRQSTYTSELVSIYRQAIAQGAGSGAAPACDPARARMLGCPLRVAADPLVAWRGDAR